MPTKSFVEKQLVKEAVKETLKDKQEKVEKHEKNETKESKDSKDQKDNPDKLKQEKEKLEKEQVKDKNEKLEKHEKIEKHEKVEKHEKTEKLEHLEKQAIKEQSEVLPSVMADPASVTPAPTPDVTFAKVPEKAVAGEKMINKVEYDKIHKHEKHEKDKLEKDHKEAKFEKVEIIESKTLVDVLPNPSSPVDPVVEQRLSALESAVANLTHFIPQELRPDLSKGALKQEPTATEPAAPAPAETKDPADKGKK